MTADLAEARGPDVACSIEVPVAWFEAGATVQIQLPRLLTCARCEGGGCDACGRRGAFEQKAAGIASEVAVVLPKQAADGCAPVKLRLPALGARAPEAAVELVAEAAVEDAAGGEVAASEVAVAVEPAAVERVAIEAVAVERVAIERVSLECVAVERVAVERVAVERVAVERVAIERVALVASEAAGEEQAREQLASAEPGAVAAEPALAAAELPRVAAARPARLPPGHLLLTVIPRAPDPTWAPPSNVQALVLPTPQRPLWDWLRPLELLLFPDRLAAALRTWWQAHAPLALRSRPIWLWAALAVLLFVLSFWLLTRSGSRSQ